MIFVTVGSAQPFDRLIQCVDAWASRSPSIDVLAQIGNGKFLPEHCRYVRDLVPSEYEAAFSTAKLVVAHAGMGTIIKAVELNKPLILMPRLARRNEVLGDHQTATLRQFGHLQIVSAAETEDDLAGILDDYGAHPDQFQGADEKLNSGPRSALVEFIRSFVSPE